MFAMNMTSPTAASSPGRLGGARRGRERGRQQPEDARNVATSWGAGDEAESRGTGDKAMG